MAAAEATTSSVQALREYIIERLSVAAVEIFTVFERTLVQYEEQMDRQRGLLDITEIKLHGEDCPQQHACKMEQLRIQERSSPLCQQEAAPPQIKEEQEELVTSLEGVQLLLRQETEDFREASAGDESDHGEARPDSVMRLFAKPYSCSECSKSFIRRCNMRRHQRTHTGEKPYSCSECGKSFVRQCHLLTHEKTHSGERPYFCSECGKSFTRRNNLMTHKKTHTGEKPYSCSECGKSFNRSTNLMTHKRTHTGEKPYACSKCPKSFSRRSSLTVHMSTHRGEKQYLCT